MAALLARSLSATFEEAAPSVPEYAAKIAAHQDERDEGRKKTLEQSLKRTFERDKDELRAFGVPIESLRDEEGNPSGACRLRRTDLWTDFTPARAC